MTSPLAFFAVPIGVALFTHALIPLARRVAHARGLVDHPSWRRNQTEAVPCSGGLAIYAAVFGAAIVLGFTVGLPFEARAVAALGLAGLGTLLLGVVDDRFGLHAEKKLLGQIVVVSLPMAGGLLLERVTILGLGTVELGLLSGPVTLFWYLGFINSINLIDGLDGLAGGVSAVVLAAVAAMLVGVDPVGCLWILACLGAVLGFLRNNLSSNRIFLGDAGSMLLGLWLGGLILGQQTSTPQVLWMALSAMAIPILDTVTTIMRRSRRGVSVFRADDEHIHHRLLRLGITPRRSVAVLLFLTLGAASTGAMFLGYPEAALLALGGFASAAVELAYRLPREGTPSVADAVLYLLGANVLVDESFGAETGHLAEVIEIQPYRLQLTAEPELAKHTVRDQPQPVSKAAEGGGTDDVVLALGEEPH
ncbi:MAG TPA: MraY family glycosyltransferase [Candidatus Krumholzibacteria bacterium]|jgi:UDP-GlcNAc:undecaprenyl-phosphate GlcNAc-1-phosphate transferase